MLVLGRRFVGGLAVLGLALLSIGCASVRSEHPIVVSKWDLFERSFSSSRDYTNAPQEAELRVVFTSPTGESKLVYGFWDGGRDWKVRFSPDEVGRWFYSTTCSDRKNEGLHRQQGTFYCTPSRGRTRFNAHGPIAVSPDGTHFVHQDSTPFFWQGDANWSGALQSSPTEWEDYLQQRAAQGFTAVEWVATQWPGSPNGDRFDLRAFTGDDKIRIRPEFFNRLDEKVEAISRAGLLSVPILFWAGRDGTNALTSPGYWLQEDQAILLGRYMVARWGAYAGAWILAGNGEFAGARSERWKRIGKAIFGSIPHAPVTIYPAEMQWPRDEFSAEPWFSFVGYQAGHNTGDAALQWLSTGPLSRDWSKPPFRPLINLGTPLVASPVAASETIDASWTARRLLYWSLLGGPMAGFTYDGRAQVNSAKAAGSLGSMEGPGLEALGHIPELIGMIDFWKLRPAPDVLSSQPGMQSPHRYIVASRSPEGNLVVVYLSEERSVSLLQRRLPPNFTASWFSPRTGEVVPVSAAVSDPTIQFATPESGDWVLVVKGRR